MNLNVSNYHLERMSTYVLKKVRNALVRKLDTVESILLDKERLSVTP